MALRDPAILDLTLTAAERRALAGLAHRIRARFGAQLEQLAVFGSRARGDSDADSDVDVLVVLDVPTAVEDRAREEVLAFAAAERRLHGGYAPLAPLVLSSERFALLRRQGQLLARDLEREGIAL